MNQYEIGDRLILKDSHVVVDGDDYYYFHTSEQIKIVDLSVSEKMNCKIIVNEQILKDVKRFAGEISDHIIAKYISIIDDINASFHRKYKIWNMTIIKLQDAKYSEISTKTFQMEVINGKSELTLQNDIENISDIIKRAKIYFECGYSKYIDLIDNGIIKTLWSYLDVNFMSAFANVAFGYSITTHKAQGSTFSNVFVDADDIFKNIKDDEARRCVYTAITRCSGELNILI